MRSSIVFVASIRRQLLLVAACTLAGLAGAILWETQTLLGAVLSGSMISIAQWIFIWSTYGSVRKLAIGIVLDAVVWVAGLAVGALGVGLLVAAVNVLPMPRIQGLPTAAAANLVLFAPVGALAGLMYAVARTAVLDAYLVRRRLWVLGHVAIGAVFALPIVLLFGREQGLHFAVVVNTTLGAVYGLLMISSASRERSSNNRGLLSSDYGFNG